MRGSIDKRSDKTYRIRIHLGYDGGQRITHTETVHGTKKEAEAKMRDLISEYDRGSITKPSSKSLNDFLSDWFLIRKSKIRQRTLNDYQGIAGRYIKEDLGKLPLKALTPLRIQKTYQALLDRGLSPQTVRRLHTVLKQSLGQAVKWRLLPHNPSTDVDLPRCRAAKVIRAMNADQAFLFVTACEGHRWGMVLVFALETGMRPEEYLALQWSDIDWLRSQVSVQKTLIRPKGGGWRFDEPKTESSRRTVSLGEKLLKDLKAYRSEQRQKRLAMGTVWNSDHDFVFTNDEGGPIHATNLLLRGFKPLLKEAGLPSSFRLYDLRHTHATLLLLSGEHIKVVSERLGHASVSITLDTYSHVLPQMQASSASKVRDLVGH